MYTLAELAVKEVSACVAAAIRDLSVSLSEENHVSVQAEKKRRVLLNLITEEEAGRGLSR